MEHTQTDEHFWENQHSSPTLNAWRGLAFERVCLQHIDAIKKKRNYSEPYCPKIMSGVPSKAAFNALTAFMPFFLAVPM